MTATDDAFDAWFPYAIRALVDEAHDSRVLEALANWTTDPDEQRRIADLADLLEAEAALYDEAVVALDRGDHDTAEELLRRCVDLGVSDAAELLDDLLGRRRLTPGKGIPEQKPPESIQGLPESIDTIEATASRHGPRSYLSALPRGPQHKAFTGMERRGRRPLSSLGYRVVNKLMPGDHAWLFSAHPEEQDQVLGPFLHDGLERDEKIICITDEEPRNLPGLRRDRPPVPRLFGETGNLSVISWRTVADAHGRDDPARLTLTLEREVSKALSHRFQRVRIMVDMNGAAERPDGEQFLLACDDEVDSLITSSSELTGISHLDQDDLGPEAFSPLHDKLRVGVKPIYDDGTLRMTRTYRPWGLRLEGEIDEGRHLAFTQALAAVIDPCSRTHLELANLQFMSLAALDFLGVHTQHLAQGNMLVLDNPTRELESIIEMVGFHRLPGIARGLGWRSEE